MITVEDLERCKKVKKLVKEIETIHLLGYGTKNKWFDTLGSIIQVLSSRVVCKAEQLSGHWLLNRNGLRQYTYSLDDSTTPQDQSIMGELEYIQKGLLELPSKHLLGLDKTRLQAVLTLCKQCEVVLELIKEYSLFPGITTETASRELKMETIKVLEMKCTLTDIKAVMNRSNSYNSHSDFNDIVTGYLEYTLAWTSDVNLLYLENLKSQVSGWRQSHMEKVKQTIEAIITQYGQYIVYKNL